MEEVGQVGAGKRELEILEKGMKKYTRQGLIRFFSKMPPDKRPCGRLCPIATYMSLRGKMPNDRAADLDPLLAYKIDASDPWSDLTAKQIVQIAKSL